MAVCLGNETAHGKPEEEEMKQGLQIHTAEEEDDEEEEEEDDLSIQ